MNCYFHPQAESVVTCGKCGVAMCRECETNAFFRLDGGKGQALCNRCSLEESQSLVDFESSWLKKRMVKLIICAIFIILGLVAFFKGKSTDHMATGVFFTIILWAISGAIANIGNKRDNGSTKDQVWGAIYEYNHPISSMIIGITVNAIFGPIMLIIHIVTYLITRANYKKDLANLESIKSQMNLSM